MPSKLVVAMPLYTHVSVAWFLSWQLLDKSPMVEHLAVRKLYLEASMCNMVASALKSESGDQMEAKPSSLVLIQRECHITS